MICAAALPLFAVGLCLDREPGAPWVRVQTPGQGPVFVDPTSVRAEGDEKIIRLLDTAETPATSDIYIDLSVNCASPRRAMIVRLTEVKSGKTTEVAPANREPADASDPFMAKLIAFVCDGTPLR
ncbi:MAG: hypothetical protein CVT77_10515 [Alphaproteobacteria bacterium HGW-Alphaproteobacteria-16]|nr:MAG: hypothetical protein CVT77_10515 [Alphaproteobacteria bacterium HGW-Alphaproteobacteria-16]